MVIQCNPFVANPPFLKSWEIRLPTPPLVDAPEQAQQCEAWHTCHAVPEYIITDSATQAEICCIWQWGKVCYVWQCSVGARFAVPDSGAQGNSDILDPFAKFEERSFILARKRVTWPRPHSFQGKFFTPAVGLAVVNSLTKFKQCSFIHSRRGFKIFEMVTWLRPRPFQGNFFTLGSTLPFLTHLSNLKSVASSIPVLLKKFKICRQIPCRHRAGRQTEAVNAKHYMPPPTS